MFYSPVEVINMLWFAVIVHAVVLIGAVLISEYHLHQRSFKEVKNNTRGQK